MYVMDVGYNEMTLKSADDNIKDLPIAYYYGYADDIEMDGFIRGCALIIKDNPVKLITSRSGAIDLAVSIYNVVNHSNNIIVDK